MGSDVFVRSVVWLGSVYHWLGLSSVWDLLQLGLRLELGLEKKNCSNAHVGYKNAAAIGASQYYSWTKRK